MMSDEPNLEMNGKSFYIETYGCQMNEYDSLLASALLKKEKGIQVDSPDKADLVLINTCAVRENAHTKIYNRLQHLKKVRNRGGQVAILGCMAQNLREELHEKDLPIDFIMGPDALRNLPQFLDKDNPPTEKSFLKLSREETYDEVFPYNRRAINSISAFVTIQRGCNNFCSFCVVPYTRGRERSRPPESIVQEVTDLKQRGVKSITLLGQNVNSYKYSNFDFTSLIQELLEKTSIDRIYFTSPHPKDFPEKLIHLMSQNPRLCNSVHMPLQAGSNAVLKSMKRNYTKERFLEIVQSFRSQVPDIAISTDVIVGFPTETEADFLETLDVMEKADFDSAFMFAYSQRKGTIAARLYEDNIPASEKSRRLDEVIHRQNERSLKHNLTYTGKIVNVMVEGIAKRDSHDLLGRMTNSRKVIFSKQNRKLNEGDMVDIKITSATSASLRGELI